MTPYQSLSAAEVRIVQFIPSALVITLLPVPEYATATKRPLPYVTDCHCAFTAGLVVHVIPLVLVITRLPTATKIPLPYVTEFQLSSAAGVVWVVQVVPSGLVIIRSGPVPVFATATKIPLPYVTEYHVLFAAAVWIVHVIPSGLVITLLNPPKAFPTATKRPLPYVTEFQ